MGIGGRGIDDVVPTLVEEMGGGALQVYDDGRIVRSDDHLVLNVPPSVNVNINIDTNIKTRDVVISEELGIWVRLFLPPLNPLKPSTSSTWPVALFLHGGGFCFFSPAFVGCHSFCERWAERLGIMMVSVNYRLAPEHRLPAAYDDSITALAWLFSASDPWLHNYADLSNVFVIGESSGGNIGHHLPMRARACDFFANIRGAILIQPFFGGSDRTQSEKSCPADVMVSVEACDQFWRLALPVETHGNRNHPFSNPVIYFPSQLSHVIVIPPMLVVLGGKDCLRDRGEEYYEAIKTSGKSNHVQLLEFDMEEHGFHLSFNEEERNNQHASNNEKLMQHAALFVTTNTT